MGLPEARMAQEPDRRPTPSPAAHAMPSEGPERGRKIWVEKNLNQGVGMGYCHRVDEWF